jgi:beta-galactosidase/beta-glucuronidase
LFPSIALPKLTIPVKGDTATVPVQCLVVNCAGVLNLQSMPLAGAASVARKHKTTKPKVVSYGTASFSLKAGATGKVKVKLDAAGRKLVKAHSKTKVWANVRFTTGAGKPKSTRVTLKR